MPKHVSQRLSSIKVQVSQNTRLERIHRFLQFYMTARSPQLTLSLVDLDDT